MSPGQPLGSPGSGHDKSRQAKLCTLGMPHVSTRSAWPPVEAEAERSGGLRNTGDPCGCYPPPRTLSFPSDGGRKKTSAAGGLAISVGVSPRQPLADWAAQAATLEAEGAGRIWLIDSQLA